MKIVLTDSDKIYRLNLPDKPNGIFWLTDNDGNKLIKIESDNGEYKIISDEYAQIIKPKYIQIENNRFVVKKTNESVSECVILKKVGMYAICLEDSNEIKFLYSLDDDRSCYSHFDIIGTSKITIGTKENNTIIYKSPFLADEHLEIVKNNNKWSLKNKVSSLPIFVNDVAIHNEIKELSNGDCIFVMGLSFIIINDSIFINLLNDNVKIDNKIFVKSKIKNTVLNEKIEKSKKEKIKEIKYYSRSPRLVKIIRKENLKIDEPPSKQSKKDRPIILTLATSLSMGIMSVAFTFMGIGNSRGSGNIIYIIMAFLTFFSMIIIPILNIRYDKKAEKKYENKRQLKYKEYLDKNLNSLNNIKSKQRNILYENYLSAKECEDIILSENHRLWERKIDDKDFLSIRLGIGDVPLEIDISEPKDKFEMDDDELLNDLRKIIDNAQKISSVPIGISLKEKKIISLIMKDNYDISNYVKNIILQLVTLQGYDDLKLVFFIDGETEKWQYVKMLPHIFDDSKQIRFFANNYNDMDEIARYLEEDIKNRENSEEKEINIPHYLIITNNYKKIEYFSFVKEIINDEELNFSLLCISKDFYELPNKCKTFIVLENGKGSILDNENSYENEKNFEIENIGDIDFSKIIKKISNIPIKLNNKTVSQLPTSYNFLEMYNVGNIEKLEILNRWKKNDSTLSLKAPIGVDGNGMLIYLDIHEKYHGPHGLIAGATGSGKSEFIITYILSLAVNYHPDDLKFLLIDYKGGGLAGAFERNEIKLPHIIGKITNIDSNGLKRSLVSIQSELKRRQIMFNEARNMTNEGTIDIYKYQRLYHEGIIKEPIPHLLIISDEFAELKQQQPDFMDELMSVSRIGRSLGVHLILATQKPAGIVNDQIRSNSKFAVCLKVQDTSDSSDVIKKRDAAFLKNTGQFYLQVGNDEYFVLGQSAWTGANYEPSDTIQKKIDTSVEFISNIGTTIKRVDADVRQSNNSCGEQLTNIVTYIHNLAKKEGIQNESLWLSELSKDIYIDDLKKRYNDKNKEDTIEAIIGEYDDPAKQNQGLVRLDLLEKNDIAIYGNEKSGKETFLSTLMYDLMTNYSTEQVQFYIMDFGTEALKIYKNSPHVGDVIVAGEEEKIDNMFKALEQESKNRKNILSEYNGNYDYYLSTGKKMPLWCIVINNYDVFEENYSMKYGDILLTLSRDGLKCGIIFIITASTVKNIKYRLRQYFSKKFALQANDDDEYFSIFEKKITTKPGPFFGRGILKLNEDDIVEFQMAKICEHVDYNTRIEETIKKLNEINKVKAKSFVSIPKVLTVENIKEQITDVSKVPIGMYKEDNELCFYDFTKNYMTVIVAENMMKSIQYTKNILNVMEQLENVEILILDPDELRRNINKGMNEAFNEFIQNIKENCESTNKFTICVIIGIDRLITDGKIDTKEFCEVLELAKKSQKYAFIIIDNPKYLDSHTYDDWYRSYVDRNSGIWVGNGIANQSIINNYTYFYGNENKCGNDFGFLIKDSNARIIKLLGIEVEND